MRPKFQATDMTMTEIRDTVTKRGWRNFRAKTRDGELYVEKKYWWEIKRLPRLRAVK